VTPPAPPPDGGEPPNFVVTPSLPDQAINWPILLPGVELAAERTAGGIGEGWWEATSLDIPAPEVPFEYVLPPERPVLIPPDYFEVPPLETPVLIPPEFYEIPPLETPMLIPEDYTVADFSIDPLETPTPIEPSGFEVHDVESRDLIGLGITATPYHVTVDPPTGGGSNLQPDRVLTQVGEA
jgi:hypothetical protein